MELKCIQHTQRETCALAVIHETLGAFELWRTTDLKKSDVLLMKGAYIPKLVYGTAIIKINTALETFAEIEETIMHELLHHVFHVQVRSLKEEQLVRTLTPLLPHIVKAARELTSALLDASA
jgi:hypothetical protein